jgi:hypothetical protein
MKTLFKKIGNEKLITNLKGEIEFVIIPYDIYNEMLELMEDHGLALSMDEAKNDKTYVKDEALKYLSGNES